MRKKLSGLLLLFGCLLVVIVLTLPLSVYMVELASDGTVFMTFMFNLPLVFGAAIPLGYVLDTPLAIALVLLLGGEQS